MAKSSCAKMMLARCRRPSNLPIEQRVFLAAAVSTLVVGASGSYLPEASGLCIAKFRPPKKMPEEATHYNGLVMNDTCFKSESSDYDRKKTGNPVFVIGDWGGINHGDGPQPADHTNGAFKGKRPFNWVVDKDAQQRVAQQFNHRAPLRNPDYVINVGDNFYWGGLDCKCGRPLSEHCGDTQWKYIYEQIYKGKGVDGVQWLGVMGNHDYGGWRFDMAWDQVIGYTWGGESSTGRWVQPAMYYKSHVFYDDFSIDYFFLDSNIFDVRKNPWWDPYHNICGGKHTHADASCGNEGPQSLFDCAAWFGDMWTQQQSWLEKQLRKSVVDGVEWQTIVTHFPPYWGQDQWAWLSKEYGIDLFITGHVHKQEVLNQYRWDNQFKPTVVLISGGGGGITSEFWPDNAGNDDQYGFMDLTLFKDKIKVEALSHSGALRSTTWFGHREAQWKAGSDIVEVPMTSDPSLGLGLRQHQEPNVVPTGAPDEDNLGEAQSVEPTGAPDEDKLGEAQSVDGDGDDSGYDMGEFASEVDPTPAPAVNWFNPLTWR